MADMIMSALTGGVVVWSIGPVIPVISRWIGKAHLVRLLLYTSIASAALSSRVFPYSHEFPKRLVLQHSLHTTGGSFCGSAWPAPFLEFSGTTMLI